MTEAFKQGGATSRIGVSSVNNGLVISAGSRTYILVLLTLMNVMAYVDRSIVGTLAQAIKVDLTLTDSELGLIGGLGFAVFYGICGIPIARLAERYNRSIILGTALGFWSIMTAACGLAHGFWTMMLARIGVGAGEAGTTTAHSIISDLYPVNKRASALGLFALGAPLGIVFGGPASAWVADEYGWRMAFFAVGVPGVILAALLMMIRDTPRGYSDGLAEPPQQSGFLHTMRILSGKKSFNHLLAGISIYGIGSLAMSAFIPAFLIRNYGISLTDAALIFAVSGMSSAVGVVAGGYVVDWAAKRDERAYLWIPAIGITGSGICWFIGLNQSAPWHSGFFFACATFLNGFYMAPSWALAQNLAPPQMRSTAAAMIGLTINVVASALGPLLAGILSDVYAGWLFEGDFGASCPGGIAAAGSGLGPQCAAAANAGLTYALLTMTIFYAWGTAHYLLGARTVRRELESAIAGPADAEIAAAVVQADKI